MIGVQYTLSQGSLHFACDSNGIGWESAEDKICLAVVVGWKALRSTTQDMKHFWYVQ